MIYAILVLALLGLLMAWRTSRKQKVLTERISQLNSRIYQTRREMLEAQEKTHHDLTALKFDWLKSQGKLQVTPDMTLDEVLMVHPMAGQVLASFHIGGCSSCAVDGSTRLDRAVASSGQTVEPIIAALNNLITKSQNGTLPEEVLKTPNMQLNF
jgi:hypothetical protein